MVSIRKFVKIKTKDLTTEINDIKKRLKLLKKEIFILKQIQKWFIFKLPKQSRNIQYLPAKMLPHSECQPPPL